MDRKEAAAFLKPIAAKFSVKGTEKDPGGPYLVIKLPPIEECPDDMKDALTAFGAKSVFLEHGLESTRLEFSHVDLRSLAGSGVNFAGSAKFGALRP